MRTLSSFWERVDASGDCWLWTGTRRPDGYGTLYVNNRHEYAHRFAYADLVGPIPAGFHLDHLCRTTSCVNPDHLEVVTPRINMLRSSHRSAVSVRSGRCIRGHLRGPGNDWVSRTGRWQCRPCRRERYNPESRHHRTLRETEARRAAHIAAELGAGR